MLFGPAYKGIPLVDDDGRGAGRARGRNLPFAFNRKEAKDHGEGGTIVGAPLAGRVLIVDDVITAGTAIRESVEIIRAPGATPAGVLIALDREERGQGEKSAVQEVEESFGLPVRQHHPTSRPDDPPRSRWRQAPWRPVRAYRRPLRGVDWPAV